MTKTKKTASPIVLAALAALTVGYIFQGPESFAQELRSPLNGDQQGAEKPKLSLLVDLSDDEKELKKRFSKQAQHVRVILILSPT